MEEKIKKLELDIKYYEEMLKNENDLFLRATFEYAIKLKKIYLNDLKNLEILSVQIDNIKGSEKN